MFRFKGEGFAITATDRLALSRWAKELKISPDRLEKELVALAKTVLLERILAKAAK